jgi:activator of HSP90 ATPase
MALKTGTIRQKVFIPSAQPLEVYDALVDPKIHSAFTGSKATMNPRPGGKFTAWGSYITGKNLELVKGKKLVQEWKTSEWPEDYPSSILELTFTAKSGGTEIRMVHSKVPASQVAQYRSGWTESYWDPMKRYFEKRSREE